MLLKDLPSAATVFAEVIIPLAIPKTYTYVVPELLVAGIKVGARVEVNFGKNKVYAGIVAQLHQEAPAQYKPKPIVALMDETPVVTTTQLQLWQWISQYYCCTLGEVMNAALPANLKLASETRIVLSPLYHPDLQGLSNKEFTILEALSHRNELGIPDIQDLLEQKTVYPLLKSLLEKQLIYLKEDVIQKYQPKKVACVRLQAPYTLESELLSDAFELIKRSEKQTNLLLAFLQLHQQQAYIRRDDLYKKVPNANSSNLQALEKKGIFEYYEMEISRIRELTQFNTEQPPLSEQQQQAITQINSLFQEKNVVLLHGVTGSGKTRVYTELIQACLAKGGQALYLLPEIALTTQIILQLQKVFHNDVAVYHSKLNNNERVEVWKAAMAGKSLILGARSSIFLPFKQLQLIIVDEEHDPSFKQNDPNPRYQARDTAIYLAQLTGAKVLLGTATPSVESYQNVITQKYGLVKMPHRVSGVEMPEVRIVNLTEETKNKTMQSVFSTVLMEEMKTALAQKEQIILFQNRRGYAPILHCDTCGWHQECVNCDVSLTYHKHSNRLKCHYCAYTMDIPEACPACGVVGLSMRGFGTEKIEDEIKIFLPDARIARLDLDTARSQNGITQIIQDFEEHRLDILVGTQMISKGLDFDNVSVVGILNADQLLQFPDFRASERGFQLITQVSGRAGRQQKRGKVIVQSYHPNHPVIKEVIDHDFDTFFSREITERKLFACPPFIRLIRITLKHKRPDVLQQATHHFGQQLKQHLGEWVIGPATPYVARVRTYYLLDFWIKLDRQSKKIQFAKEVIKNASEITKSQSGYGSLRINIDVDPM